MADLTRIEVGRDGCGFRDGALAARRLPSGPGEVRVALVATHALLLADDHVRVEVVVDGPVALEVVETAGTVAYDMRGRSARWEVDVRLTGGARLTWRAEPFVVSGGADVVRSTVVDAAGGSEVTLRESIVFGRTGEVGGTLTSTTRASCSGSPALVEELHLTSDVRGGPATMAGLRCLDSLTTLGHRLPDGPDVLQLHATGSVRRWLGDRLHESPLQAAEVART
ncbi:urease accessory protein UreD [Nocardioides sp.]|uniref:urease accessory protein UreD n=1 Tax=Nocardioides sp. TaxID=35761 RepID=UPI0035B48890